MSQTRAATLVELFNHIVLPARVPSKCDDNIAIIEAALVDRLVEASRTLRDVAADDLYRRWDDVRRILLTAKTLNFGGKLDRLALLQELRRLEHDGLLILHIAEQNAGLLIRRPNGRVYSDPFEASPRSEDVLAAKSALQWDFPGVAVAVPYATFADASFQDSLTAFLEQCSTESIKRFAAHTAKAGSSAIETRDTVDPAMISQMLMTLLEVHGRRVFPPLLRKRVRDDVCWSDGAGNPWRRLPYWLVLRVGIARHLATVYGGEVGRIHYKFFMCLVLSHLLHDTINCFDPEFLSMLSAKLSRRLAKLEVQKDKCPQNTRHVYDSMFAKFSLMFQNVMDKTNARIGMLWASFKKQVQRRIHPLSRRAAPEHLTLSLPKSGLYLHNILAYPSYVDAPSARPVIFNNSAVNPNMRAFAHRYFPLADLEAEIEDGCFAEFPYAFDNEKACIEFAGKIDAYLNSVSSAYDGNAEQQSVMILTVMELWMRMDQRAITAFGLLKAYDPGFPPEALDILQLPRLTDMCRLRKIQSYLNDRCAKSKFSQRTIFDDPTKGCFAERYFNESEDLEELLELYQQIEATSKQVQDRKRREWEKLSAEFEDLQRKVAGSSCVYTREDIQLTHDDKRCTKCYLQRKARRMTISIYEHPLPSNPVQAKAVVFELRCPPAFAAYRNATWKIVGSLARPKLTGCVEPRLLLRDYGQLQDFMHGQMAGISFASTTKSFLDTHYRGVRFPTTLGNVCLPSGLKLAYYDSYTGSWPGRQTKKPSFAHRCQIVIPPSSPFASLQFSSSFVANTEGPSSNEIIASQTRCPAGLNVHEYMAYQNLYSGKNRRWPFILIELGSSNLNFGTEATTTLLAQLACQAGPAYIDDDLRTIHRVFRDRNFCEKLMEQIEDRLGSISSNWRETNSMEMLLTLILRLVSLGPPATSDDAMRLLDTARNLTYKWIGQLRAEIHRATDADSSRRCSRYALWAAILCRRTFSPYTEIIRTGSFENLSPRDLQCFVESSATLQDNMVTDPAAFPPLLRHALIRDLKMVYRLRYLLRRSLEANPDSLTAAVDNIWPQSAGGERRSYSSPTFMDPPYGWWIQITVHGTYEKKQQSVHYDALEGHLLIDHKPIGRLPSEYRESQVLEELFGHQSLLTYPSSLYGMTYMLGLMPNGHEIHLGFREGSLIVRACFRRAILEYVPRKVFGDLSNIDLPAFLVEDCVHWLDVNTGIMEIRQRPDIWIRKHSNWALDVRLRMARRRRSLLVDTHSLLFYQVARIFHKFEHPARITVFQPEDERSSVQVELRRLQLSFAVSMRGYLICKELRAEIDPNQDAGTWYGLDSKLVLRDTLDPRLRTILVPMGPLTYSRNQCHVALTLEQEGLYGRFTINDVLGRLDCPAEPRLLYLKAALHAFTSFVVADPLTGRTGTEEALHCLQSGLYQPWMPLNPFNARHLVPLARLTPKRVYYPEGLRAMQQVFWDPHLTTTMQRDEFMPAVEAIYKKSANLSTFAPDSVELPPLDDFGDDHLLHRSTLRHRLFLRSSDEQGVEQQALGLPYDGRDRCSWTRARCNVFETAILLRKWSCELPTTPDLAGILQNWPTIQGFGRPYDKPLLTDHIGMDFSLEWGSLVDFCRNSGPQDVYRLTFLLTAISFRNDVNMDLVTTLVSFAISKRLKALEPPGWPSYSHFRQNHVPTIDYLMQLIKPFRMPYPGDERATFNLSAKVRRKLEAAETAHGQQTENDSKALAEFLLDQWPCAEPSLDGFAASRPLLNVSQAMTIILPEWLRLYQNLELSKFTSQVQQILDYHRSSNTIQPPQIAAGEQEILSTGFCGGEVTPLRADLLRKTHLTDERWYVQVKQPSVAGQDSARGGFGGGKPARYNVPFMTKEAKELESIISDFTGSKSRVRQRYGQDLAQSLNALKSLGSTSKQAENPMLPIQLSIAIYEARQKVSDQFKQLCAALEEGDVRAKWLTRGGMWPCITTITLVEQLRTTSLSVFGSGMREALIAYAISITMLQRLLRMNEAHVKGNHKRLFEEQKNLGHQNWQPSEYPDWLLMEIDANLLIRPDQVDVALATISPTSGSNSRLLRVVVPKALLLQTAQLMQARVGGLLGREVRHVPFSRKTPTTPETTKAYWNLHKEMLGSSGVMVALPEHIMSFMLSGIQRFSDNRVPEATPMVKVQTWMRKICRDVLDECDFTLAVRTQLIYPSGQQTTVDGHPHRWETAEALLRLVEGHLFNLRQDFPRSIDVVRRPGGGFPFVFFLRKDAEDALTSRLVKNILRGQSSILPTNGCTRAERQAIRHFITDGSVRPATVERIQSMFPDMPVAKQNLYLLRGLLVHRILLLTLKKRWNVQYGLHETRDPIAVPYHAKGVPSDQAEWGHPDVAILFTCLSFYFGGLSPSQLRQSLEHLVKSDDPSSEYDRWTHSTANLPDSLREWNVINVDDEAQLLEIWQHLRFNVVVIDYFLNRFVFPRHAKQFRIKLQASGWDIPLTAPAPISDEGKLKPLTTGFSGTNDNRTMLPLTIKQEDLPRLSHTNAEVLTYLLQDRNRQYMLAADPRGRHISEVQLLRMLHNRSIRMLIDAGAQILEMDNHTLAKEWLRIDTEAKAALYFDKQNRPYILYHNGKAIPLLASPFADDLSACLVYLDEAHTRGTDLKMPTYATGALTLGLGQTKDHTVQAAMRLRELATTQSVVFFAAPEVHQSILDQPKETPGSSIDSHDVIRWLLEQTCSGIEQLQPLYYSQGVDYCHRSQAAINNPDVLVDAKQREAYLKELRQMEHQTLEQLYKPRMKYKPAKTSGPYSQEIAAFMKELNTRRKGFQDLGNAVQGSALQEVEQEREVSHEVEAVREVQKPVHFTPLTFSGLHRDIFSFVKTGRLAAGSAGYEHMFVALSRTALGLKYQINRDIATSTLFISKEFLRTVSLPRANDNFLRQVNWVLWSVVTDTAMIITPEEAEHLIPIIREARNGLTNLLTYAAPVTRKMLHFNDLNYYAIPPMPAGWNAPTWLTIELGLFAGRLYFDFDEYSDMAKYLGLHEDGKKSLEDRENSPIPPTEIHEGDEAIEDVPHAQDEAASSQAFGFTTKPLTFLQEWLAVRRKGQDFTHTPMGYVCQSKPLTANHPFFNKAFADIPFPVSHKIADNVKTKRDAGIVAVEDGHAVEYFDDEGLHDDDGDEIWYNASEYGSDVEDIPGVMGNSSSGTDDL
ncbi:hypothetical protein B0J12DRAFT_773782 [Macrophomina phaseolina]|uniref:ubiquitinyl hydrolase 1 n=1 Tax=Macrophomina phaseolina TaxID=35725 RepID=A0ABQ8FTK6_9PEZI|nr:hypothetical protein B0J12DRAFT_773782 [Macrophomina phaseolina]